MTDWPTLKMGYEVLGTDVQTLAEKGSTTVPMIEYAIKEEGWVRQEVANLLKRPSVPEEILVDVQGKLENLYTLAQSGFNERYLELESSILSKAISIVTSLEASSDAAPLHLAKINEILNSMKETAMLNGSKSRQDKDAGGGVTIQIMQNYGTGTREEKVDKAFEIAIEGDHVTPLGSPGEARTTLIED